MTTLGDALRSIVSFVALTVAALMVPVVVLGGWVHGTVSDTDTFTDQSREVLADDAVRETVSTLFANEVVAAFRDNGAQAGLDGLLSGGRLPSSVSERITKSRDSLGTRLHESIRVVVLQTMGTPAFEAAWTGSTRAVHEQLIETLDSPRPLTAADGTISLDLARAGTVVKKELRAAGFTGANRIPAFRGRFDVVAAEKLEAPRRAYRLLDVWSPRAPWILLGAVVLGLAAAHGRLKALSRTASWAAILLALCLVAVSLAGRLAAEQVLAQDVRNVVVVTWQQICEPLNHRIWSVAIPLLVAATALRIGVWVRDRRRRRIDWNNRDPHADVVPGLR